MCANIWCRFERLSVRRGVGLERFHCTSLEYTIHKCMHAQFYNIMLHLLHTIIVTVEF